jgi:hypothetical protein
VSDLSSQKTEPYWEAAGRAEEPMIQLVEGLPDNIIGIVAKGRLTNNDWNTVLKPLFETSLKRHEKVRLYYEIGARFPGAAWGNLRLGIENAPQWERVAIVTDVSWLRDTINALRFLMQAEVRVFSTSDACQGRAWISSTS